MSDIVFDCPLCSVSLNVDASAVGMRVDCPTCEREIEIPSGDSLAPPFVPDAVPSSEPASRAERQHQHPSAKRNTVAAESGKRMPFSASDFRKILEDASAVTVGQIEEASKQTRMMIGD